QVGVVARTRSHRTACAKPGAGGHTDCGKVPVDGSAPCGPRSVRHAPRWRRTPLSMPYSQRSSAPVRHERSRDAKPSVDVKGLELADFARASDDVYWLADPTSGRLLYVSPRFERYWGVARDELMAEPRRWTDAVH